MDAFPTLRELIREDWVTHNRAFSKPGLHAIVVHRLQVAVGGRKGLLARALGVLLHAVNVLVIRNVYGVELYPTTKLGRRVDIAHHQGVVLGRHAVIGDDVLIRQHVTLGQQGSDATGHPVVGNGVRFGPGSTVVGGVTIGEGAIIGAHALVLKNVPAGATAMVSPARILPRADPGPASQS